MHGGEPGEAFLDDDFFDQPLPLEPALLSDIASAQREQYRELLWRLNSGADIQLSSDDHALLIKGWLERDFSDPDFATECLLRLTPIENAATCEKYFTTSFENGLADDDLFPSGDRALRLFSEFFGSRYPKEACAFAENIAEPLRSLLLYFAGAKTEKLSVDVAERIAQFFLSSPPGRAPIDDAPDKASLIPIFNRLLHEQHYPIIYSETAYRLLNSACADYAKGTFLCYRGRDFRRCLLQLSRECFSEQDDHPLRKADERVWLEFLAEQLKKPESLAPETRVAGALCILAKDPTHLESWVLDALRLELRANAADDVELSRAIIRGIDPKIATQEVFQALPEERAVLMIAAAPDKRLLGELLRYYKEGKIEGALAEQALLAEDEHLLSLLASEATVHRYPSKVVQFVCRVFEKARYQAALPALLSWLTHPAKAAQDAAESAIRAQGLEAREALIELSAQEGLSDNLHQRLDLLLTQLERLAQEEDTPAHRIRREFMRLPLAERRLRHDRILAFLEQEDRSIVRKSLETDDELLLAATERWFIDDSTPEQAWFLAEVLSVYREHVAVKNFAIDALDSNPRIKGAALAGLLAIIRDIGEGLAEPIAFKIHSGTAKRTAVLLEILAQIAPESEVALWAQFALSTRRGERNIALLAGKKLSSESDKQNATKEFVSRLVEAFSKGGSDARRDSARLLELIASVDDTKSLLRLAHREKHDMTRAALEAAAFAISGVELDQYLATHFQGMTVARFLEEIPVPRRIPRFLRLEELPTLRDDAFVALPLRAVSGLLCLLMTLEAHSTARLLHAIAQRLHQGDLSQFLAYLFHSWHRGMDNAQKWAVYAAAIRPDNTVIDALGEAIGKSRSRSFHATAAMIQALADMTEPRAFSWLQFWSVNGASLALRDAANAAKEEQIEAESWDRAAVIEAANPYILEELREARLNERPEIAEDHFYIVSAIRSLERAMMSRRRFDVETFESTFLKHPAIGPRLNGLLIQGNSGVLHQLEWDAQDVGGGESWKLPKQWLHQVGGAGKRSPRSFYIPHPAELSREDLIGVKEQNKQLAFPQLERNCAKMEDLRGLFPLRCEAEIFANFCKTERWAHGAPQAGGHVYEDILRLPSRQLVAVLSHSGYNIADRSLEAEVTLQQIVFYSDSGGILADESIPGSVLSEIWRSLLELRE